ncbi:MAG: glycosyltransferase family 2 protein [Proteobacteria bacterium]|nr:glycosyltransferase family 2 protein [Pseudomonadota bacterium]
MDAQHFISPCLSIVIPVFNEKDNLQLLTRELTKVLQSINKTWEIILVDDGSTDGSIRVLRELQEIFPYIRVIKFRRNCGQTAAFDAGFKAAKGEVIITMDSDLQNDPHDIPKLLDKIGEYDAVCGWRHKRNDPFIKRISSRIANAVRNRLSNENIIDVGCSLKAFRSEYVRRLKLYNGMHRFFPTLIKMEGGKVIEIKVNHRSRKYGLSKYNIRNRMVGSFIDLLAVRWMKKRRLNYEIEEDKT